MLTDSKTWNDLKPIHEGSSADFRQASLDILYISGTNEKTGEKKQALSCSEIKKKSQKERYFPDHDRWHSLSFRDFALEQLRRKYGYLGVDFYGDVYVASGNFRPRWSDDYGRWQMARIYKWAEASVLWGSEMQDTGHISTDKAHFVTLTVRHDTSGTYSSMVRTLAALRASWEGVRRWVNRKGWHYLRVMEPGGETGYPHYHMIIIGADDQEIEEFVGKWVTACNNRGNGASRRGQNWQRADNIKNVGAYVVKYLSKSFKPEDVGRRDAEAWWRWMELGYRENIRTFAMDQKSAKYIRKIYPGKPWTSIGVMEFVSDYEPGGHQEPHQDENRASLEPGASQEPRAGECPPCGGMQSANPAGASVGRSPSGTSASRQEAGKSIEEVLLYG